MKSHANQNEGGLIIASFAYFFAWACTIAFFVIFVDHDPLAKQIKDAELYIEGTLQIEDGKQVVIDGDKTYSVIRPDPNYPEVGGTFYGMQVPGENSVISDHQMPSRPTDTKTLIIVFGILVVLTALVAFDPKVANLNIFKND